MGHSADIQSPDLLFWKGSMSAKKHFLYDSYYHGNLPPCENSGNLQSAGPCCYRDLYPNIQVK